MCYIATTALDSTLLQTFCKVHCVRSYLEIIIILLKYLIIMCVHLYMEILDNVCVKVIIFGLVIDTPHNNN